MRQIVAWSHYRFVLPMFLAIAFCPVTSYSQSRSVEGNDVSVDLFAITRQAQALIEQKKHAEAVALLDPVLPKANFGIANTYYDAIRGVQGARRPPQTVEKMRTIAESGNPFIAFILALLLSQYPVTDPSDIEKYYLIAHNKAGLAAYELGNLYYGGLKVDPYWSEPRPGRPRPRPVDRDLAKAKSMFENCIRADSFYAGACDEGLGHVFLEEGQVERAVAQFEETAAYGTLWAMHYFGIGVQRDASRAEKYRKTGIEWIAKFKRMSIQEQNKQIFVQGCTRRVSDSAEAMMRGDPKATVEIAYGFYATSIDKETGRRAECFPYRPSQFIELLRRAADTGHVYAASNLANYFRVGDVIPKDNVLAHFYSSIVAHEGNATERESAFENMRRLEPLMSKGALEEVQGMFRKWEADRSRKK